MATALKVQSSEHHPVATSDNKKLRNDISVYGSLKRNFLKEIRCTTSISRPDKMFDEEVAEVIAVTSICILLTITIYSNELS